MILIPPLVSLSPCALTLAFMDLTVMTIRAVVVVRVFVIRIAIVILAVLVGAATVLASLVSLSAVHCGCCIAYRQACMAACPIVLDLPRYSGNCYAYVFCLSCSCYGLLADCDVLLDALRSISYFCLNAF